MFEKGQSVTTKIGSELRTAKLLNKFFSNTAKNLEILKCSKYESFVHIIEDQALRAILNIKITRALLLFKVISKVERDAFYFRELEKEEIEKQIHKLNTNKASLQF